MIVIDSSGWIQYFMNGPLADPYAEYLTKKFREILTPSIILYEVYKKLKKEVNLDTIDACLSQLEETQLTDLSPELAYRAVDLSLEYKLALADSVIYATAISHGAKLITSDADFKNLPGVHYISPEDSMLG
jgi:toxin FitB